MWAAPRAPPPLRTNPTLCGRCAVCAVETAAPVEQPLHQFERHSHAGERLEEERVDQAEDRRVPTDAQGES